jgi:hypothetical protein
MQHLVQWMSQNVQRQATPATAPGEPSFASWAMPPPGLTNQFTTGALEPRRNTPPPPVHSPQQAPTPPAHNPGPVVRQPPASPAMRGVYIPAEPNNPCDYAGTRNYAGTCSGVAAYWVKTTKYKKLCTPCTIWYEGHIQQQRDWASLTTPTPDPLASLAILDAISTITHQTVTTTPHTPTPTEHDPWTEVDPWSGAAASSIQHQERTPTKNSPRPSAANQAVRDLLGPLVLTGDNAKQRGISRASARRKAFNAGMELPPLLGPLGAYAPHPPICNRVASPWGTPPFQCHCDSWPMWMQHAPPSATTLLSTVQCTNGTSITLTPSQEATCSYWRPGTNAGKERGYYNGVVHQLFRVNRPNGTSTIIIAVN